MRYTVEVTVSEISVFYVEADSKHEAEQKAKDTQSRRDIPLRLSLSDKS